MESTKRMKRTTSARVLIECNMLRRSQLVLASCSNRAAFTNRVATIRLLLKFQVTLVLRGPTRVLSEIATRSGAPVPRPARQPVLLVERKNHVNGGVHFDRLAIEQGRLIAPLPDGIQRGLLQQWMAADNFDLLNRAVLAVDGEPSTRAGDAGLARQRRINRLNTVDDARGLDLASDAERTSQLRLRRGRRTAHASDDSTEYTAHGATGNAAGHTAGHTSTHVRLGVFLDNLDVLGDNLRRHKLACIHQAALRLHLYPLTPTWTCRPR